MPLVTETTVTNADPATIAVTVRETTGPGGTSATVDVFITVNPGDATFVTEPEPTPASYQMNRGTTLVAWRSLEVGPEAPAEVQAHLTPGTAIDTPANITATCTVSGVYGGDPYLETANAVVCFP